MPGGLFSEAATGIPLYRTSSTDLSLALSPTQFKGVPLKIEASLLVPEKDFIDGISPPLDTNPIQIFFRTSITPLRFDGLLDDVVGWREDKVIVDIMAYSMNNGEYVITPEQTNDNDLMKKS